MTTILVNYPISRFGEALKTVTVTLPQSRCLAEWPIPGCRPLRKQEEEALIMAFYSQPIDDEDRKLIEADEEDPDTWEYNAKYLHKPGAHRSKLMGDRRFYEGLVYDMNGGYEVCLGS